MTANDLNKLLNDEMTVDHFVSSIADEVENYRILVNKKGSMIELRFEEDASINLDRSKFKKLLILVSEGKLSSIALAYICDCLTLAEELTVDQKAKVLIFELADPEINGGYKDKNELKNMISKLD
jgi:hypothetical protein